MVHASAWAELNPRLAHDLLRLRVDVFVVEQACCYPELDGRDVEPDALHVWTADGPGPTAYLRVLSEPGAALRVGRVCTRADARGRGLAGRLLSWVIEKYPACDIALEAQAHLVGWYRRFGFRQCGEPYLEDGIEHLPMLRPAPRRSPAVAPSGR